MKILKPLRIGTEKGSLRLGLARGFELLVGSVLALMAFLFVLWLLNLGFPMATNIGDMMRRRDFAGQSQGPARVRIDGSGGQPFVAVLSEVYREV
jgi:hypothetical protein